MITTAFLAKFFGLYMAIMGVAILIRPGEYDKIIREMQGNSALTFVTGIFTLMLGLFLVLAHNVWTLWLPAIVTLLGWMTLVKGIIFMTFPEPQLKLGENFSANPTLRLAWVAAAIGLGGALAWFGFTV